MDGQKQSLADIRLLASDPSVYEPSDDSFALVDTLASYLPDLKAKAPICLEIGTGSGYVICSLALILKEKAHLLGVDLNPLACACSQETLKNHKVCAVDLLCCDLLRPLSQRLAGKVDLLVFNPPYVPTPDEEVHQAGIAQAWAGGMRGRRIIDRVLPLVPELLARGGHFFLVTVSENDPQGLCKEVQAMGLKGGIAMKRQADEESLSVLHFEKL